MTNPWRDWLSGLPAIRLRGYTVCDGWIEHRINDAILAADARRLAIDPTAKTNHFAAMWEHFRHHHVVLDGALYRRCLRYCAWRFAALGVICDRDRFQDDGDRVQARALFDAAMSEFSIDPDEDYTYQQAKADSGAYLDMVIILMRAVA